MDLKPQPATLILQVTSDEDADADERDQLTRQLLSEVRELDLESAEMLSGDVVPEGAKAAEVVTMGTLVVAVLPAMAAQLVECLLGWTRRADNRHVIIKTQVGDRTLELDFTPETAMSEEALENLAQRLTAMLTQQGSQ
jgi:hypothetical protein